MPQAARGRRDSWAIPAGDQGLTLPELIITMIVVGVVLAGIAGTTAVIGRTMSIDRASARTLDEIRTAMVNMTKVIRAASIVDQNGTTLDLPPFAYIGATVVVVYSALGESGSAGPSDFNMVKYYVHANGSLVECRWLPVVTAGVATFPAPATVAITNTTTGSPIEAGCPTVTGFVLRARILANANFGTQLSFVYYAEPRDSGPTVVPPLTAGTTATSQATNRTLATIRMVRISLQMSSLPSEPTAQQQLVTDVVLPVIPQYEVD